MLNNTLVVHNRRNSDNLGDAYQKADLVYRNGRSDVLFPLENLHHWVVAIRVEFSLLNDYMLERWRDVVLHLHVVEYSYNSSNTWSSEDQGGRLRLKTSF